VLAFVFALTTKIAAEFPAVDLIDVDELVDGLTSDRVISGSLVSAADMLAVSASS